MQVFEMLTGPTLFAQFASRASRMRSFQKVLRSTRCERVGDVELVTVVQYVCARWRLCDSSRMPQNAKTAAPKKCYGCVKYVGSKSLLVSLRLQFWQAGKRTIDNIDANSAIVAALVRKIWPRFHSKRKLRHARFAYDCNTNRGYCTCAIFVGTKNRPALIQCR